MLHSRDLYEDSKANTGTHINATGAFTSNSTLAALMKKSKAQSITDYVSVSRVSHQMQNHRETFSDFIHAAIRQELLKLRERWTFLNTETTVCLCPLTGRQDETPPWAAWQKHEPSQKLSAVQHQCRCLIYLEHIFPWKHKAAWICLCLHTHNALHFCTVYPESNDKLK